MPPSPHQSTSWRILAVDDEPSVLKSLRALLRADGHSVAIAESGSSALELFRSGGWDVVLTDRNMPEMNGEELAREIKNFSPHTPVIMITGLLPSLVNRHVDAIFSKPVDRAALYDTIGLLLSADPASREASNEPKKS